MNMKAAIISFPGSNREIDATKALKQAGFATVDTIFHTQDELPSYDLLMLPGGFSHGDYLRCGAMAVHSPVMKAVKDHAVRGGLVYGVCNGFQILCETGLLPGALMRNNHLKFNCKWVDLEVTNNDSAFTKNYKRGQIIRVPIAHGDGNYQADDATIKNLEDKDLIAFKYANGNPNGSAHDIAGIFNEGKNICGMMPHPEDAIAPHHQTTDGIGIFKGLLG